MKRLLALTALVGLFLSAPALTHPTKDWWKPHLISAQATATHGKYVAATSSTTPIAPGCTAAQPTWLGGTIESWPGNQAVNVGIGIVISSVKPDGSLQWYRPDGTPVTSAAGYSYAENVNPTLPIAGQPVSTGGVLTWGQCVTGKATRYDYETYPHQPSPLQTNKSTFVATAYYAGKIVPGSRMNLNIRMPYNMTNGGNVGGVQGYVTYQGHYVPASDVHVLAFPGPGNLCGVRGFAAASDSLGSGTNPDRTYYRLDTLVAGQCWAPYQAYQLRAYCRTLCGTPNKMFIRLINVVRGQVPRVDITFN